MRQIWEMQFASSGPEALATLAKTPFDVVVSDMRMPGIDGARLLDEVMLRHPQIVRIILSGQSSEDAIIRCVEQAHIFLSKPCDPDSLKSVIERACSFQDLLAEPNLRHLVSQMRTLPSIPSMYRALSLEIRSPEPSLQKISQIICRDPSIATKILQLVNSAFFGVYQRVTSIERAVTLLGLKTIESLVLSTKIFSQFKGVTVQSLELDSIVKHSISTGAAAGAIMKSRGSNQDIVESAITAGLLHDIGKLVLASNMLGHFCKALTMAKNNDIPIWDAERAIFGASHAEVGAYLAGLWGLPGHVVEAITYHHNSDKCPQREFSPLTAVHVADVFDHELFKNGRMGACPTVNTEYLKEIKCEDRLSEWHSLCESTCAEREAL
jgi:putative nucleotidyltransferase with HDIG domain